MLITLSVFISCNMNRNSHENIKNNHTNSISEVDEVFDSTYYFILKNAYINNDTIQLNAFFEKWSEASLKAEMRNENKIAKVLNDIFIEVYHPFNYEKYDWLARPEDSVYRYVILPSEIKYKITNSLTNDRGVNFDMDTLKGFYPNPNFKYAKRLLDIDPFKKSMKLFLEEDSYKKLWFLGSCNNINTPISYGWKDYRTTPEIKHILINKKLNKAVALLRVVSAGVSVELSFKNNKWNVEKVNQLWQE